MAHSAVIPPIGNSHATMLLPQYPDARTTALFLDFDGTLVEIAERPDAVMLADETRAAVGTIARHTGGALGIVTGRDIATIDAFIAPLRLPIAGVHGLSRRDAQGQVCAPPIDVAILKQLKQRLNLLCATHPGLIIESKAGSVALHYRARPDLQDVCLEAMQRIVAELGGLKLQLGKMVVEALPEGASKGVAVLAFMSEAPFAGRVPLFAGDDVTDEGAFAAVNSLGGISIKVGDGASRASFRAQSSSVFLEWLVGYARYLEWMFVNSLRS